jgi:hypothetical protein
MKRLTYYLFCFISVTAFLMAGCDNSSIVKDNTPPP